MNKKLRFIVDMDDVLADASQAIIDIFNELNHTQIEKSFFETTNFYEFVNSGKYQTYRHRLFEPGFFGNLEVIPDAQEVLKELSEKHEVFVVSSATEFPNSLKEKFDWMQRNFPFISWRNFALCGDKSIIKGDIMIDDHEKNLSKFEGRAILFEAAHNHHLKDYERVKTWKEIAEKFL
ncbi:MAG: 5'-3'-deoxyribonucleotidase [Bacteroidetes bacterium]|nr:5'-3'-deoxyribonucleotidase [Bacteroidota bacterium]